MTARQLFQKTAERRFVKYLDKAIAAAYEAGIENRGDVLTLPLKELYHDILKRGTPRTAGD